MSLIVQKVFSADSLANLLICSLCIVCVLLWKRRRLYFMGTKFPGSNGYPIIGSMLEFSDVNAIVPNAFKMFETYGSIFKVWIGPALAVVICNPVHLQTVLNNPNCLRKCLRMYNGTMEFIGTGLILAEPEKWRVHRKILNPGFNQKILDSYVALFTEQSKILVQKLKGQVGKGAFDMYHFADKCTLDIVCETTMATKVEAQTNPSTYFETTSRILYLLAERIFRVWLHPDFMWNLSWRGREMKKNVKSVHLYTNLILENAMKYREKDAEIDAFPGIAGSTIKRRSLLDILLDAKESNKFTHMEILHEMSTFILAGTDTSAATISFCMMCMAFYPEILKKVQAELDETFGNSDREITLEDMPKLDYLDRVIKETLRMYPAVTFTGKRADVDIDLGDGYVIPKDSTIMVSHLLAHYNPEQWKNPNIFDPDRFLPEEIDKRHPYSYIPFSAGPRNCIGFKYGMIMMKVVMANVLRKYVPKTHIKPKDLIFSVEVVLKLKGGFMITLEERT